METILSICVGLGLSAACGFRVFIPLLGLSIAAHAGHVDLASDFQWLASTPAVIALSIATALEIAGFYVPWLDHFLDTVATPSAIIAGIMATAAMTTEMSPFLRWSLAVIAGGGVAAAVQATTVTARAASTLLTGGLGNPLVATAELGGAVLSTTASILVPALAVVAIAVGIWWQVRWIHQRRQARLAADTNTVIPA